MSFTAERENNIIRNIAREIEFECTQAGLAASPELAEYLVKIKLLNPSNGFTASEVMPRSLTQKLVRLILDELTQDNPSMNCIRMQIFWDSTNMNLDDLKKNYALELSGAGEPHFKEILALDRNEELHLLKNLGLYVLTKYNLGTGNYTLDVRETTAAARSVVKKTEMENYFNMSEEDRKKKIETFEKIIAGIRLYLSYLGKAGKGLGEVHDLLDILETERRNFWHLNERITSKIDDIREVISNVVPMDYFMLDTVGIPKHTVENLPTDCEEEDLKHIKKLLVIMLQHKEYIYEITSKLDEIDGNASYFLKKYDEIMEKLQDTIRKRHAVPTVEVFDDFVRAAETWMEIDSYFYCLDKIQEIGDTLETYNKKEYFLQTTLEKAFTLKPRDPITNLRKEKSLESSKTMAMSSMGSTEGKTDDVQLEFQGYCAWTLYYNEGMLMPGAPESGVYNFQEKYFAFSSKSANDLWAKDPQYCLMEIYAYLRDNPELIYFLNAYDSLYRIKTLVLGTKVDRKVSVAHETVQTVLHPIEEHWDKDYTFSIWELKKRALALSRLVKCVTKSVQTESPHSNFRASIGLLAAPDKDKEAQTKRDSHCNHSTISNYLYGLRGHREDKFCIVELTRPVDESFESVIYTGEEEDCCRARRRVRERKSFFSDFCPSESTDDKCYYYDDSSDYLNQYNGEY